MDTGHIRTSVAGVVDYFKQNPGAGRGKDSEAVAALEDGLRCRARAPDGTVIITDMPKAVGGEEAAPTPGWLMRAALATCDATMIAMRAAVEGVTLTRLEVSVDSDSDDRGLVGADDTVPAGPLQVRVKVRMASDASPAKLREIVDWAERHSPVGGVFRKGVPTTLLIESN
ncbi:MAG: OsmC family protein [Bauldia sp.]|nr:OsmC family protein [Bauldia sp.]